MLMVEWYRYWDSLPMLRAEESLDAYAATYAAQMAAPAAERSKILGGWIARLGDSMRKLLEGDKPDDGHGTGARGEMRRIFGWMNKYGYAAEGSE